MPKCPQAARQGVGRELMEVRKAWTAVLRGRPGQRRSRADSGRSPDDGRSAQVWESQQCGASRQIGRLGAVEDISDVNTGLMKGSRQARRVADQAARRSDRRVALMRPFPLARAGSLGRIIRCSHQRRATPDREWMTSWFTGTVTCSGSDNPESGPASLFRSRASACRR